MVYVPSAVLYVLDTPTVVCIAFAAFVIGALLTGALWFIYSNTGSYAPAPWRNPSSTSGEGLTRHNKLSPVGLLQLAAILALITSLVAGTKMLSWL